VVRLRAQRNADVEALISLAQRAWKDVEASVDAILGSPLDRLATPSWAAHHEGVVRAVCDAKGTTVVVAEDGQGELLGFAAYRVHQPPADRRRRGARAGSCAVRVGQLHAFAYHPVLASGHHGQRLSGQGRS
jgi:hypothetical protein